MRPLSRHLVCRFCTAASRVLSGWATRGLRDWEGLEMFPYCLVRIKRERGYFAYNPVHEENREIDFAGDRILEQCDGARSLEEIAENISGDLRMAKAESLTYAINFLNEMSSEGMVAWRAQPNYKMKLPAPNQIIWDITRRCNLRCTHCYNSDVNPGHEQELSTEEIKLILREIRGAGVEHVAYSGGEPFMREDFTDIAQYSAGLGFSSISVATNGSFIDRETASRLKQPNLFIQVSVDGDCPEVHDGIRGVPGSHQSALKALQVLMDQGVNAKTCTTVTNANYDRVRHIIQLMKDMGVKGYRFQGMVPCGRGKGNAEEIILSPNKMKTLMEFLVDNDLDPGGTSFTLREPPNEAVNLDITGVCSAGYTMCSITSDGTVVPCTYFGGANGENLRYHSFQWIWEHSTLLNYFRTIRLAEIKGVCRQCPWFMRCRGGCRAEAYLDGDLFGPNRNCWVSEELAVRSPLSAPPAPFDREATP